MKTRTTFFTVALSLMIFLTLQIPSPVNAQGAELGDGVVITAEVVAIDRVDRVVTLLGPRAMLWTSRWGTRPGISIRLRSATS